jgi:hypothetical protein
MTRWIVAGLLSALVPPPGVVLAQSSPIGVVAAERGWTFGHGMMAVTSRDDDSVVLVVTVRGFTEHVWNRLPPAWFTVTTGETRVIAAIRTASTMRPEVFSWSQGEPRLAFVVPKNARAFDLRFRNGDPIRFTVSDGLKTTID